MYAPRRSLTAIIVAAALVSTGCRTDDAAKKDIKQGAKDVKQGAKKAKNKVEKAIPGDSNDNGK